MGGRGGGLTEAGEAESKSRRVILKNSAGEGLSGRGKPRKPALRSPDMRVMAGQECGQGQEPALQEYASGFSLQDPGKVVRRRPLKRLLQEEFQGYP